MKFNIKFIERANIKHNYIYDYTNSLYINNKTKLSITCKKHGEFYQIPINHLNGSGCPECYLENKRIPNFIELSLLMHDERYSYNLVDYKSNTKKVKIICDIHGVFEQQPKHHLNGHGCPKCGGTKKLDIFEFIERSNLIHKKDLYDYTKVNYKSNQVKVTIICNIHGEFEQRPDDHMRGRGCKTCSNKFGIMENSWLDSLNIEYRQVKIDNYIVDGYDPISNTIYEFNGDYWHGNPNKYKKTDINPSSRKTFGELYKNTIDKENSLRGVGYNVVSIWESEYIINKNNKLICH